MQIFQELVLESELKEAARLLAGEGLLLPGNTTYACGLYEEGRLIATGFLAGSVLCGICVDKAYRGAGLAAQMAGHLVKQGLHSYPDKLFLFTKPSEVETFASIGFVLVAKGQGAALLEWGHPNCAEWIAKTKESLASTFRSADKLACVVINANPCTFGHIHLIMQAQKQCGALVVFVVEEDSSSFPFNVRYALVKAATAHIPNVLVLPAGPYMVSLASFPAYFTGHGGQAAAHANLDATIFATRIGAGLNITERFVGDEPYCKVTADYNAELSRVLPEHDIALHIIPRAEVGSNPVSASEVRRLLSLPPSEEIWLKIHSLVPEPVFQFLRYTGEAAPIISKLQQHAGARH